LGKPNTIYYVKVVRTKDNGTWQSKTSRETEVLLERQAFVEIKKQSF
jgi:hypothetical protein